MSETPPEEYTDDDTVWPIMVMLSQCLCEELTKRGLMPGDCFCGVVPGAVLVHDYAAGEAWVRLVNMYPSTTFPQRDNRPNNCATGLGATLEVGVMQCAPGVTAAKKIPSQADKFEQVRLQMATMNAMRQAIICCGLEDMVLGQYDPAGPQGLQVGGTWTLDVWVG